jgi:hypothetical protein
MEVGPPAIRFGEWSLGQDNGEGSAPLAATPPEGANPGTAAAAAGGTRLAFTATAAAVWEAGR